VLHNFLINLLLDELLVDLAVEEELNLQLGVLLQQIGKIMSACLRMRTDLVHARLDEDLMLLGLPGTGEVGILLEGMRALYWELMLLLSLVYDHKLEERSRQPKGVHYPSSELGM
jgi:hypothetical protein